MTKDVTFDPIGKAREQLKLLERVPEPGEAFHVAAKAAMQRAGVPDETIEFLDREARARSAGK
ncbi:hypothetical protein QA645_40730 [Bradyrhizobium sp. CIAT3101]|uniref:hypothetical protein n=1 Tax=Bradyrhizobium sp. CIAT3101 TaxID=439387 RepID=UPI0024B1D741|nr:hypothetical protein [Bradyrhizobium sp. CIAT3101]WFU80684.1 hypothetical protein QA645_40730 [Bradyrhizobium sp. CIAT3101]